jgi:hypothetical protein
VPEYENRIKFPEFSESLAVEAGNTTTFEIEMQSTNVFSINIDLGGAVNFT